MSTIDPNALFFGNFLDGSSRLHDPDRFAMPADKRLLGVVAAAEAFYSDASA